MEYSNWKHNGNNKFIVGIDEYEFIHTKRKSSAIVPATFIDFFDSGELEIKAEYRKSIKLKVTYIESRRDFVVINFVIKSK